MAKPKLYLRPAFLSERLYGFCGWHGESWRLDGPYAKACPKCCAEVGSAVKQVVEKMAKRPRNVCAFGHGHDSVGEAECCPLVYQLAKHKGLVVYQPGKPGIPCFSLDPDPSTGRPVYVSVDWLLRDAQREPAEAWDYKGNVAKAKRFDKGWARGKRILETELSIRVFEIKSVQQMAELADLASRNSVRPRDGREV